MLIEGVTAHNGHSPENTTGRKTATVFLLNGNPRVIMKTRRLELWGTLHQIQVQNAASRTPREKKKAEGISIHGFQCIKGICHYVCVFCMADNNSKT